jgi:hypothetical protein
MKAQNRKTLVIYETLLHGTFVLKKHRNIKDGGNWQYLIDRTMHNEIELSIKHIGYEKATVYYCDVFPDYSDFDHFTAHSEEKIIKWFVNVVEKYFCKVGNQ